MTARALDWLKKYNMCGSHPLWVSLRRVDPLQLCIAHPKQLYAVAPRHKSNNAFTAWYILDQLLLNLLLMIALY